LKHFILSISELLKSKKIWIVFSIAVLGLYLLPLFLPNLYVQTYDNLDSNVVWYKILAESGKIFAPNDAIIPNMMNGLPRASYGSEFDILLWLYYFFDPKTAYLINEVIIHLIAFFGSYLFLEKYIVKQDNDYRQLLIFIGSLYFATLPFWSGGGITIASLPLTTYVLLDIKNRDFRIWHWIYIILLPFYTSLVLMYLFYIGFAWIYLVFDTIKNRHLNKWFFFAIILMSTMFVLKEYRLFLSMFFDSGFVSHRTEFEVFFTKPFEKIYRPYILQNFLIGFYPHLHTLQQLYLIPLAIVSVILLLMKRNLTTIESLVLSGLFILSFIANIIYYKNIWTPILTNNLFIPIFALFILIAAREKTKYRLLPLSLLLIMLLSFEVGLTQYQGLHWITNQFPIFKAFNLTRASFITPILWLIVLVLSASIIIERTKYGYLLISIIFLFHIDLALNENFYQRYSKKGYLTFEKYYDKNLFQKIKHDLEEIDSRDIRKIRIVNYGIEPAVPLYNGLYTIDGYSTNYPLAYKKKFRKTQAKQLLDVNLSIIDGNRKLFDKWGSKLYLLAVNSEPENYKYYSEKNSTLPEVNFLADYNALCDLNTSYVLSAYPLKNIDKNRLELIDTYHGTFWHVWLYRLICFNSGKKQ